MNEQTRIHFDNAFRALQDADMYDSESHLGCIKMRLELERTKVHALLALTSAVDALQYSSKVDEF